MDFGSALKRFSSVLMVGGCAMKRMAETDGETPSVQVIELLGETLVIADRLRDIAQHLEQVADSRLAEVLAHQEHRL